MLKRSPHRPAHLLLDQARYFITDSIYQKRKLLTDALKAQFIALLQSAFAECNWQLQHWVVLDDHYHLMAAADKSADLPKIVARLHYRSGQAIRKIFPSDLPVWRNYWDYCPRNEKDYLTRLNDLLNNPVKHGYTNNLHDYPFSSFQRHIDAIGRNKLRDQFIEHREYQTLMPDEDDF